MCAAEERDDMRIHTHMGKSFNHYIILSKTKTAAAAAPLTKLGAEDEEKNYSQNAWAKTGGEKLQHVSIHSLNATLIVDGFSIDSAHQC